MSAATTLAPPVPRPAHGKDKPMTATHLPLSAALPPMLYSIMKHRTQLYLDDAQYRWLCQRAGKSGSIAAVVRDLIDAERARRADPAGDPLLTFLVADAPARGREQTSVTALDRDLYGR